MNLDKLLKLIASIAIAALLAAGSSSLAGAKSSKAPRTVELKVTENGYEPSPLSVKKGEPLRLRITRTTDATCAKDIVLPDFGIEKQLPLNKPVEIDLTPSKSGKLKYGCSMGLMVSGVLIVE